MNKKIIKILIITIIMIFIVNILNVYAAELDWNDPNIIQGPISGPYVRINTLPYFILSVITIILTITSIIFTIITTIKCKDKKSLGAWIILFIIVYLLAKFKKEIYPIRLVITAIQIIIEILMIILPIKKLIKYKKSDKNSKGENQNVRND